MKKYVSCFFVLVSLILFPAGNCKSEEGCARGEPKPLFSSKSPNVKRHSFKQTSSHDAEEEVVFQSGDVLKVRNWGCEYFVNTYRYESRSFHGSESDKDYWFKKSAEVLKIIAKSSPTVMFDLEKAAVALEAQVKERSDLEFNQPVPVAGDGDDFLQTQVAVKGGSPSQGNDFGYVEIELMKGPL